MSRGRWLALAALLTALVGYGAIAPHLPSLRTSFDVLVQSALVFPAFASAVWVALPLARATTRALLIACAVAAVLGLVLVAFDVDALANVAKLVCYALLGFAFLSFFEELWWVALVAVLVPWVDIWSVATGPTQYVVEQRPGIFERIAVGFPSPGESSTVNIGPPDVLFFALFLAAADRFGLRVAWTWVTMTALLAGTLVLVWAWDGVSGLPALPAICLGFLLPNADLLWRGVVGARARA